MDRIVLASPAVSAEFDLRPALLCARDSVDVFYSERDWGYLGVGTALWGTSDRRWSPPAGRIGFNQTVCNAADAALYAKLRQHPWHPAMNAVGNYGGHYGANNPAFLRTYILPIFRT